MTNASVKTPSKREARAAERRVIKAKVALTLCTAAERAEIFRAMGQCACHSAVKYAVENPGDALAAGLGALVGIITKEIVSRTSKQTKGREGGVK